MNEEAYHRNIVAALQANDTKTAIEYCYRWQESGADVYSKPTFFLAKAMSHAKRGHLEGVKFNLNKIVELLGK